MGVGLSDIDNLDFRLSLVIEFHKLDFIMRIFLSTIIILITIQATSQNQTFRNPNGNRFSFGLRKVWFWLVA